MAVLDKQDSSSFLDLHQNEQDSTHYMHREKYDEKRTNHLLSPAHIQLYLESALRKQREAIQERDEKRKWCAKRLRELRSKNTSSIIDEKTLSQFQQRYDVLQKKLTQSQFETQRLGIDLTSKQIFNDKRESNLMYSRQKIENVKYSISKIYDNCALEGLHHTVTDQTQQNRRIRFDLVLQLFDMFRVEIGDETEKVLKQYSEEKVNESKSEIKENQDISIPMEKSQQSKSKLSRNPKGYGKISGLPLPHAGLIYYALFPPIVLTSSLRLVSLLTSSIARCFKIDLPHPILIRPGMRKNRDIFQSENFFEEDDDNAIILEEYDCNFARSSATYVPPTKPPSYRALIKNPASNLMNRIIPPRFSQLGRRPWGRATEFSPDAASIDESPLSITATTTKCDNSEVLISLVDGGNSSNINQALITPNYYYHHYSTEELISHATYAIIQEKRPSRKKETVTTYSLLYQTVSEKNMNIFKTKKSISSSPLKSPDKEQHNYLDASTEDQFSIGLQLLQNNVVALCIRAGVPVEELWPAEAILLNLYSLWVYCQSQIMR